VIGQKCACVCKCDSQQAEASWTCLPCRDGREGRCLTDMLAQTKQEATPQSAEQEVKP
jgi:hypothetical protein